MRNNKEKLLKSFSIDFNWLNGKHSPKNAYSKPDAAAWADWCQELGCNNFWTFAMSFNGYAWYDSKLAPKIEGLEGNFTRDCVEEGHKRGMSVFAYHNLASNPVVEKAHPEWSRKDPNQLMHLVFCEEYLDVFCQLIYESITECGYDGLVIDWFQFAEKQETDWIPKEKEEFRLLMGYELPDKPEYAEVAEYQKRSIEKAWKRVKETVISAGDIPIWTNQPFWRVEDPVWNGNILLKETDYVLNESPDFDLLAWLDRECGENTQIIQNFCGWPGHDSSRIHQVDFHKYGIFGFAAADPNSCMPFVSVEEALKNVTPKDIQKNPKVIEELTAQVSANCKNIELTRELFHTK